MWHFPFFGWLFSLFYAIVGLLYCLTVVGAPIGLGLLQLSKFLLAPFGYTMVTRSELESITHKERPIWWKVFSLIVRILYFPFGLTVAFFTLFLIAGEFITLVGIPCAMVWGKALSTLFNPVNKVCVPKAIAEEIERNKSAAVLQRYTNQGKELERQLAKPREESPAVPKHTEAVQDQAVVEQAVARMANKSDEELKDIIANPDNYSSSFFTAAEIALQRREEKRRVDALNGKVAPKSDEELERIIADSEDYSAALVEAARAELGKRKALRVAAEETAPAAHGPVAASAPADSPVIYVTASAPADEEKASAISAVPGQAKTEPQASVRSETEQPASKEIPRKTVMKIAAAALAVLIVVGGTLGYFMWYVPYARDRDALRTYVLANNVFLRSTQMAGVEYNILGKIPYGSELITYTTGSEWASVKVNGMEGYMASPYLLTAADFRLLNGAWGSTDTKECIESSKCRLAILDFYKRNNLASGSNGWQIYTKAKNQKPNNVFYPRLYDRNSKFTDFVFIVKENASGARILACYSFEDETEKPVYRFQSRIVSDGYLQNVFLSYGNIKVRFDDGEVWEVPLR